MPELTYEFEVQANEDGEIALEREATPPISGRILYYSIETETGCIRRVHPTALSIHRKDDPGDNVEIEIEIPDCTEVEGPVDYRVRGGKTYLLKLKSEGFSEDETVKGTATVRYRIGATGKATTLGWERQYEAEEALKAEMRAKLQGRYVEKDTNPGKERCPLDGTRRKHGTREYQYFEIEPDYGSLEIWVDWQAGRARGSMRIGRVFAHANEKKYHKCTGQAYSATVEAKGYVDLNMNIDALRGRLMCPFAQISP